MAVTSSQHPIQIKMDPPAAKSGKGKKRLSVGEDVAPVKKKSKSTLAREQKKAEKVADASAYNGALKACFDSLVKNEVAKSCPQINYPVKKRAIIPILMKSKWIGNGTYSLQEREELLIVEALKCRDWLNIMMIRINQMKTQEEKLSYLRTIFDNPSKWNDYSKVSSSSQKKIDELHKGSKILLNFIKDEEFIAARTMEISSRKLNNVPLFDESRKESILIQLVTQLTSKVEESESKQKTPPPPPPAASKHNALVIPPASTCDMARQALENNALHNVVVARNPFAASSNFAMAEYRRKCLAEKAAASAAPEVAATSAAASAVPEVAAANSDCHTKNMGALRRVDLNLSRSYEVEGDGGEGKMPASVRKVSMSPPSTNGTHQLRPPSNNDESYAKEPSTNPFYRPNNEVTLAMTTYNNPPTQTLEQRLEIPSTHATTSFDAYQGGIEDEPEIYVPGRY